LIKASRQSRVRPTLVSIYIVMASCIVSARFLMLPARAHSPEAHSKVSAMEVVQTHSFLGTNDLIVSQVGLRLQNKGRLGFTLVSSAPDWRVTVFREDDKTYYGLTLDQFERTGLWPDIAGMRYERTLGDVSSAGKIKVLGWPARYVSRYGRRVDYLSIDGSAARQIESIIYAAYKVPTNGGICLQFVKTGDGKDWITGLDQTGQKQTILATQSIKSLVVSRDIFRAPTGYQAVKSMQQVFSSTASRDSTKDMDQIFDEGSSSKKEKTRPGAGR
jgi:hypothetical protein